jgi:hypothetical protein
MADFVFNISLGQVKTQAGLANANDAIIVVPIETTGIEADGTLRDHDDLAALLAGTSNEQTTLGRKTITSVTITVDDTNNRTDFDVADQTWAASAGNAISALVFNYDSDTTGGGDASIVPMSKHDFVATPDGSDITAVINASGIIRAAG